MLGQGKFTVRVGVWVSLGLRVRIIVRVRINVMVNPPSLMTFVLILK